MAPLTDDTGAILTSRTSIPRKYMVIPKNQKALLDRPDAWESKGRPNFPTEAIKGVRDAYLRRLEKEIASKDFSSSAEHHRSRNITPTQRKRRSGSSLSDKTDDEAKERSSASSSDEEEVIPWTPSPTSHKQAPIRHIEPPRRPSLHGPGESSLATRSSNLSQSSPVPTAASRASRPVNPQKSPFRIPRRSPVPSAAPKAPAVKARARAPLPDPPSSLGSELGLDFSPPKAITDVVNPSRFLRSAKDPLPVQKVLRSEQPLAPTPPSAQEPALVPSTLKGSSIALERPQKRQRPSVEPPKKRKRLMKPPPFEDTQEDPSIATAVFGNDCPPLGLNDITSPNSSSGPSLTAESPIKLAPQHRGRLARVLPSKEERLAPVQRSRSAQSGQAVSPSPVGPEAEQQHGNDSSGRLPPNGPPSQAPYAVFTDAYPTYKGSPKNFVRAALSIEFLQKRDALPEFLYDDFIRVWAHEYLAYMEAHLNDLAPLTVLQYYNKFTHSPRFTKGIFNRANIADIRKHMPAEICDVYRDTRGISLPYSTSSSSPPSPAPRGSATVQSTPRTLAVDRAIALNSSPPTQSMSLPRRELPPSASSGNRGLQQITATPIDIVDDVKEEEDESGLALSLLASPHRTAANDSLTALHQATHDIDTTTPLTSREHVDTRNIHPQEGPQRLAGQPVSLKKTTKRLTRTERPPSVTEKSNCRTGFTTTNVTQSSPGDILTQPPATAASYLTDFTRSVDRVPETAIKPKEPPKFLLSSVQHSLPSAVNLTRCAPNSSAGPASSAMVSRASIGSKRFSTMAFKGLSQKERWRKFLELEMAERRAGRSSTGK